MSGFAHGAPLYLLIANVLVFIASLVWARRNWRLDRLALRGFDLPFEPAGPFRQSEPELRPLFGFERDSGAELFFILHLLAAAGGVSSLATTLYCASALTQGIGEDPLALAAFAGLCATIQAVPMWRGQRVAHAVLSGVVTLFVLLTWPPAITLVLVIVVVQHDLIRRRAIADEREQERRDEHARRSEQLTAAYR